MAYFSTVLRVTCNTMLLYRLSCYDFPESICCCCPPSPRAAPAACPSPVSNPGEGDCCWCCCCCPCRWCPWLWFPYPPWPDRPPFRRPPWSPWKLLLYCWGACWGCPGRCGCWSCCVWTNGAGYAIGGYCWCANGCMYADGGMFIGWPGYIGIIANSGGGIILYCPLCIM